MIRKMNPRDLKPHSLNKHIYGVEPVDEDLVQSIKEHGLLENLVIKEDGTILSGHRRWRAILELHPGHIKTVPCEVVGFSHDEDGQLKEEKQLLEYNRQRKKTKEQLAKEGKILEGIYAKQAEKRRLATLKQNQNNENDSTEGANLPPRGDPTDVGNLPTSGKTTDSLNWGYRESKDQPGKTKAKVAKELEMGEETYRRLSKLREATESENLTEAKIATENLQDEEKSIHRSYEDLKEFQFIQRCSEDLNLVISAKAKAMLERIDSADKVHGAYHALKFVVDKEKEKEEVLRDEYPSDDYESSKEYIDNEDGFKIHPVDVNPEKAGDFLNTLKNAKPVDDSPKSIFKKDEEPERTTPERQEYKGSNEAWVKKATEDLEKAMKEIKEENQKIADHPLYSGWQKFQKLEYAFNDLKHALKTLECPKCGAGPEKLKWTCCDITAKESVKDAEELYHLNWREYREKYGEEVVENAK